MKREKVLKKIAKAISKSSNILLQKQNDRIAVSNGAFIIAITSNEYELYFCTLNSMQFPSILEEGIAIRIYENNRSNTSLNLFNFLKPETSDLSIAKTPFVYVSGNTECRVFLNGDKMMYFNRGFIEPLLDSLPDKNTLLYTKKGNEVKALDEFYCLCVKVDDVQYILKEKII